MKNTETAVAAANATPLPVIQIPIGQIVPDPKNRKDHDKDKLQLLADEITVDGLLQPILVRPLGKDKYQLIAGERRWLAHQLLKRATIEARIVEGETELQATRKRLAENFHREDLSPIEKADALQQLFDLQMPQAEIAAFVGAKDQSTVSNLMRLRRLPAKVKEMVHDGRLSRAHGVALLRFEKFPKVIEEIALLAVVEGASSKSIEKGLPFAEALEDAELAINISEETGYDITRLKELPKELQADPDFIECEDEYSETYLFCLDVAKGKKLGASSRAEQEARSKRPAGQSGSASEGGGRKLSPKEVAERRKKIEDNKANRAKATVQLSASIEKLKTVKKVEKNLLLLILGKVLSDGHYKSQVKAAAEKLGIKLPDRLLVASSYYTEINTDKLAAMSEADMLRLTAAAVVLFHGDNAIKFAHGECEETTLVAGKYKAAPQIIACSVTVTGDPGRGFKATAGSQTASSTNSPGAAARSAAATHMGCPESDIELTSQGANRYTARRRSAIKPTAKKKASPAKPAKKGGKAK